MKDLAPAIYRQRLVVEGYPDRPITDEMIKRYLSELSTVIGMRQLIVPVTHKSDMYGWAGWVHWETSGAHLYAWEKPQLFLSVDIYTCKHFNPENAANFTKKFFNMSDITHRSF